MRRLIFVCFLALLVGLSLATVGSAVYFHQLRDLDFGDVRTGSPPTIIEPTSNDAARVDLRRDAHPHDDPVPFKVYFDQEVILSRVDGSSDTVTVSNFVTDLPDDEGEIGRRVRFNIGATLLEVPYNILGGEYFGMGTITVVLQD